MQNYYPKMKWIKIVDETNGYFPSSESEEWDSYVLVITKAVEQVKNYQLYAHIL